jgi:hypothetical protein
MPSPVKALLDANVLYCLDPPVKKSAACDARKGQQDSVAAIEPSIALAPRGPIAMQHGQTTRRVASFGIDMSVVAQTGHRGDLGRHRRTLVYVWPSRLDRRHPAGTLRPDVEQDKLFLRLVATSRRYVYAPNPQDCRHRIFAIDPPPADPTLPRPLQTTDVVARRLVGPGIQTATPATLPSSVYSAAYPAGPDIASH